jgi:hypothetical protein
MTSQAKSFFNLSSSDYKKYFGDVKWVKNIIIDMN